MTDSISRAPRLSLGPVQYYWPERKIREFYARAAKSPVDIVYLGEMVCAKRRALDREGWLTIAAELEAAGKEVVLTTLTLLEAASELGALRHICSNGRFAVEANDMAAAYNMGRLGKSFVGGPGLNIYNLRSLNVLASLGMKRWVPPIELPGGSIEVLLGQRAPTLEVEVFAWGRMALAYSARCYTARAANVAKDACNFICLDDPDGRLLHTQDGSPFLVINGIQTQSALTHCLAEHYTAMVKMGVDVLRISPQSQHTFGVVDLFDRLRRTIITPQEAANSLRSLAPIDLCDGYWAGTAGMINSRSESVADVEACR